MPPHSAIGSALKEQHNLEAEDKEVHLVQEQDVPRVAMDILNDPHRGLLMRHVALIGISSAIGAGLFISIGGPLTRAGPLGLILGMGLWCLVIFAAANCLIEITTLYPVDGGFIRYAERFVDKSFGTAIGWNFIISNLGVICFEMTALNVVIEYWKPLHPAIIISVALVVLAVINLWSVHAYGEVEFWISISKLFLCLALTFYTLVTMLGGNPIGDRYGFRFWKDPGPFVGSGLHVIRGLFSAILWSAYALTGPEYLSIVAGEVKHPRRAMPRAFKSTVFRILFFYMTGAVCVSVVAASNDPSLLGAIADGAPGAAKSPYVISMNRLKIPVLPHIVNALIILSIFSTTNSYVFSASRSMVGLAHRGMAPKILLRQSKRGLPYIAVTIVLLATCLSYLAVSAQTAVVLNWWISLVGSATLINWTGIGLSYLRFRDGLKSQDLFDGGFRPVRGYLQPWSGWWLVVVPPVVFFFSGWTLVAPGGWNTPDFLFTYGAGILFAAIYLGAKIWEVSFRNKAFIVYKKADQLDFATDLPEIEAMTVAYEEERELKRRNGSGLWHKIDRVLF